MNVIITGTSGMVGKGVLIECIESPLVKNILVINRQSINKNNPKVNEIIHQDFSEFDSIKEELKGYDACFHCMGVSAVGMSEEDYTHITYNMTKALAGTLYQLNPGMVFNYVSGAGTDSSEKGRLMWARVKGRTENLILNMGFKDAYAFRPGAIIPEKGVKSSTSLYNTIYILMRPFFALMKKMDSITTSVKVGQAMINSVRYTQALKLLENRDINALAAK